MMKQAMLLSAGRGSRLAPLTDTLPKPLVQVGGEPVIARQLRALVAAGVEDIVINLHHLGEQIRAAVGDGAAFGARVRYSEEVELLGVAGGVRQAIARGLLTAPFILANSDIVCDFDLRRLPLPPAGGCHLLLVETPPAKARGDFSLADGTLHPPETGNTLTYAGIGAYDPTLFAALPIGAPADLLPLLMQAIKQECAQASFHTGEWHDIGTPKALEAAQELMGSSPGFSA